MLSRKCHFCYENSSFPASRRLIHKKRSKIINNFSKSEIIFYVTQHIFIFLHYYAQNLSIHNAFGFIYQICTHQCHPCEVRQPPIFCNGMKLFFY